jgi:hypothetical protein
VHFDSKNVLRECHIFASDNRWGVRDVKKKRRKWLKTASIDAPVRVGLLDSEEAG